MRKKGRTVSPVCFHPQEQTETFLAGRPVSCPPPEVESEFSTPLKPKRRRTSSYCDTPSSRPSPESSPLRTPTLILTPSSQRYSASPSPTTSSDLKHQSARDESSLKSPNQCPFCLFFFKNCTYLRKHRCLFQPNIQFFQDNGVSPLVLTRPRNWRETVKIIGQLCKADVVKLCILQNWCLPSFYPFCFPHQIRSGRIGSIPLIEEMTAARFSGLLLRSLLEIQDEVKLPKHMRMRKAKLLLTYLLMC